MLRVEKTTTSSAYRGLCNIRPDPYLVPRRSFLSIQRPSHDYRRQVAWYTYWAVVRSGYRSTGYQVCGHSVSQHVPKCRHALSRTLVRAFPEAALGVFYAGDLGTVYESEVIAASHGDIGSPRKHSRKIWGDRAVLILIGQKLGPNSVNEIYYTAVKVRNGAVLICINADNLTGISQVAPICRHSRRAPVIFVLLRRFTSR